jgi:hypothetical protein
LPPASTAIEAGSAPGTNVEYTNLVPPRFSFATNPSVESCSGRNVRESAPAVVGKSCEAVSPVR